MFNGYRFGSILLMGGFGERFKSPTPKQFHILSGKKLYLHTLDAFLKCAIFDEIVLVVHESFVEEVKKEVGPNITVVRGGKTRQGSSHLGLLALKKVDFVLIHDAIRPFVSQEILLENARTVIEFKAVDTCISSSDTLVKSLNGKIIDSIPTRAHYLRGQTPQSFAYDLILDAHEKYSGGDHTDDCLLAIKNGFTVHVVEGSEENIKITSKMDLSLAEQLLYLQRKDNRHEEGSLQGKKFAVVGGTGGIGSILSSMIEKEGASAIVLSRESLPYSIDLTRRESIKTVFDAIYENEGLLDGLINAAGVLKVGSLEEIDEKEIEKMVQVNLLGLMFACKSVKIREGGHIINIASSSFSRGRRNFSIYSSTKAAVVNFTQALAEERDYLRINAVAPQRTDTPLRRKNFPDDRAEELLKAEKVAETIISLLKDPDTTGSIIEVKKD